MKKEYIFFRLKPVEKEKIKKAAEKHGLTLTQYCLLKLEVITVPKITKIKKQK